MVVVMIMMIGLLRIGSLIAACSLAKLLCLSLFHTYTHTIFPARLSGSALPSPMWADTDNVDVCLIVKDPQDEWEEAVEACGKFPCFRGVASSACVVRVCCWCSCFVEINTLTHPPPPTTTISTTPTTIGADVALVLSVSQLRKNYKQFEARRKLLGAFVRSFRFPFFSFFFW